jgi:hypothetical protein
MPCAGVLTALPVEYGCLQIFDGFAGGGAENFGYGSGEE